MGRSSTKSLIVNPEFQRQNVWSPKQKSRRIESLLLNIPVPVSFLAEERDGTHVVVDGQQRLRAVEEFASGQYRLRDLGILPQLNGLRWADLTTQQTRHIYTRTIRCIVISDESNPNIRFEVFERLNTGGTPLNDQEIRNCIHRGPLNANINELAHHAL